MGEEIKSDVPEWTDVDGNPVNADALEELANGKDGDE